MKDLVARLTSEEGRAWIRRAAKLVLRVVGDAPSAAESSPTEPAPSAVADAAVIMSAVAKGASAAGRVASGLRGRASRGGFGKVALGLGAGLAIGGAVYWLASPAGRERTRALWHRARGWRRPKANITEAPREASQGEA